MHYVSHEACSPRDPGRPLPLGTPELEDIAAVPMGASKVAVI